MEQACGWLRWTPEAFWNATMDEVDAAVRGFAESKGVKKPTAMDDGDMDDLIAHVKHAIREERRLADERHE